MRCLNIATIIHQRHPEWRLRFVLSAEAPYRNTHPFDAVYFEGSTDNCENNRLFRSARTALISKELEKKPDLVIFDSCGNGKHFLYCWQKKIPTVYISPKEEPKKRSFRLRGLLGINQNWLFPVFPGEEMLRTREKWLCKFFGIRPIHMSAAYCPENIEGAKKWLEKQNLDPTRLIVFVPGGGTYSIDGKPSPQWFLEASKEAHALLDCQCLLVSGSAFKQQSNVKDIVCIEHLPNALLMGVLSLARTAVINGGSLVLQSICLKKPVVVVPLGPDEQIVRASKGNEQGLLLKASHEKESIVSALEKLYFDGGIRADIEANLKRLDMKNGAISACSAAEVLMDL